MPDAVELAVIILLNILGWIVAGYVTLLGVRASHERAERSRQRHEDRTRVFEPVRREMETIVARESSIQEGGWQLWSHLHASQEFGYVLTSGLLQDRRHDSLRRDLDELLRLEKEYQTQSSALNDAEIAAIEYVLGRAEAMRTDLGEPVAGDELASQYHYDGELRKSLSADDRECWVRRWSNLGLTNVRPSPKDMYEDANARVMETREAYRRAARALLNHAQTIRLALDDAIRKERDYVGGPVRGTPSQSSGR